MTRPSLGRRLEAGDDAPPKSPAAPAPRSQAVPRAQVGAAGPGDQAGRKRLKPGAAAAGGRPGTGNDSENVTHRATACPPASGVPLPKSGTLCPVPRACPGAQREPGVAGRVLARVPTPGCTHRFPLQSRPQRQPGRRVFVRQAGSSPRARTQDAGVSLSQRLRRAQPHAALAGDCFLPRWLSGALARSRSLPPSLPYPRPLAPLSQKPRIRISATGTQVSECFLNIGKPQGRNLFISLYTCHLP